MNLVLEKFDLSFYLYKLTLTMHTVLASILIIMYYYYMKPVFRLNFIKDLFELNLNNQSIIDDQ